MNTRQIETLARITELITKGDQASINKLDLRTVKALQRLGHIKYVWPASDDQGHYELV